METLESKSQNYSRYDFLKSELDRLLSYQKSLITLGATEGIEINNEKYSIQLDKSVLEASLMDLMRDAIPNADVGTHLNNIETTLNNLNQYISDNLDS
jgi:hypothetical protein